MSRAPRLSEQDIIDRAIGRAAERVAADQTARAQEATVRPRWWRTSAAPFLIAGSLLILTAAVAFVWDRPHFYLFKEALFIGLCALAIGLIELRDGRDGQGGGHAH